MKKKIKKIINRIFIVLLAFVLTVPINVKRTSKIVKASTGAAEIITLEMLLIYLIGLVGQNSGVKIPYPKDANVKKDFLKEYARHSSKLNSMLSTKNYAYIESDGGEQFYTQIDYEYVMQNWDTIDLDKIIVVSGTLAIDLPIMSEMTQFLAQAYDVPEFTAEKQKNTPLGNRTNIKGALTRNGVKLAESVYDTMENEGMFSYPYINVIKLMDIGVQESTEMQGEFTNYTKWNKIFIISSKYPFGYNVRGTYRIYTYVVGNLEAISDNEMKISTINWNAQSGYWSTTIPSQSKSGNKCYAALDELGIEDAYENPVYSINNNVLYSTFNVYYSRPTAYTLSNYLDIFEGQMKQSSLVYKTFLESKYGPLIRNNDDVIVVNIDNWLEYDKEGITWNIDNIANTDEAIDNLKVIDDEAKRYGDSVISKEIVYVKDIIDDMDLEKYQATIEVQSDIQGEFNNTYADIMEPIEIPENILNGLVFVAFVFGEMWGKLGSYNFVLVFSATIGALALLIGLGKQINDRGDKTSSKPSKPRKKSK